MVTRYSNNKTSKDSKGWWRYTQRFLNDMKLVREHINEKFSEESDPVKDMGIGKISKSEVQKISKILERKLQDMFPNDIVKITVIEQYPEIYDIGFNFESNYGGWIRFAASYNAAKRYCNEDKMGWYVSTRPSNSHIDMYDFDALILEIFRMIFKNKKSAEASINGQLKKLDRAKKEQKRLETAIETGKIIQQYLK